MSGDARSRPEAGLGDAAHPRGAVRERAEQLLGACRILDGERLTDAFGHVSARLEDGSLLISPRSGPGSVTRTSELVRLSPKGEVLAGEAALVPGEAALHLAIIVEREEVDAVCRFHGAAASAYCALGRPLKPALAAGLVLGGEVPVHDTALTITTIEQAKSVCQTLGGRWAVLLRGFGAVTVGRTVPEAVVRAIALERAAAAVLAASAAGEPRYYTEREAEAFLERQAVLDEQIARAWNHLIRRHT